jgi:hypothetical protein
VLGIYYIGGSLMLMNILLGFFTTDNFFIIAALFGAVWSAMAIIMWYRTIHGRWSE